jgi:hypothetical protein
MGEITSFCAVICGRYFFINGISRAETPKAISKVRRMLTGPLQKCRTTGFTALITST